MSLCDGGTVAVFPEDLIREEMAKYRTERGKDPKVLGVSEDDLVDWIISSSACGAARLGLTVYPCKDLKPGEFILAFGVEPPSE